MKLVGLLLLGTIPLFGQELAENQCSINLLAGVTVADFRNAGVGLSLSAGLDLPIEGNHHVSLAYLRAGEFNILGAEPEENIQSFDVLFVKGLRFKMKGMLIPFFPFGLIIRKDFDYLFSIGIGLSYNRFLTRTDELIRHEGWFSDEYRTVTHSALGIPVKIGLKEKLFRSFWWNTEVKWNFNQEAVFFNASTGISIALGF